jgi:hypothetical protein
MVQGPDHLVEHGPAPRLPDIDLDEERESLPEDLQQLAVPQEPNRESSRLSLILQRPTITTASLPKKSVTSSNHPNQGVFSYIAIRYHLFKACLDPLPAMTSQTMHNTSSPIGSMSSLKREQN